MTAHRDTPPLNTRRLDLVPLRVAHAQEMVGVLADPRLYEFTGGNAPGLSDLESRYERQVAGPTAPEETWHNWILRLRDGDAAVGYVQATLTGDTADVAWVVGTEWQGRGLATEAAAEMCRWLEAEGIGRLTAHIHPDHVASQGVARATGLWETSEVDDDGEIVWAMPLHQDRQ